MPYDPRNARTSSAPSTTRDSAGTLTTAIGLPLSRPDHFEQEFQDFDVPLRVGNRPPPRVQPVAAEQDGVRRAVPGQRAAQARRQSPHVLIVRQNRHPLLMIVRRDTVEPLQHFEALDRQSAAIAMSL